MTPSSPAPKPIPRSEVLRVKARLAKLDSLRTSLARVADLALAIAHTANDVAEGIDGNDTPAELAQGCHEVMVEIGEATREVLNAVYDSADLVAAYEAAAKG